MTRDRVVSCPRCSAPVRWNERARYRPFCSERCKLMDLGAWATEQYRVPTERDEAGEPPAERH